VPLFYDARGDKLGLAIGDLNERIAEKLEELETDDIDVEQRLEQERSATTTSSPRRNVSIRWRGTSYSITRRRGRPVRRCWSSSTK